MKKIIAIVLVAVMLLSLTACGEEKKLYEKYAFLIANLEMQNYNAAMGQVAQMAVDAQNAGVERPEPVKLLAGSWYLYTDSNVNAPAEVTFREDGTCTVAGQEMLWIEKHADDLSLEGYIHAGGENKYYFNFYPYPDNGGMARLHISTCQVMEEEIFPGDRLGDYLGHPKASLLMKSWDKLDGAEALPDYFWIHSSNMDFGGQYYSWQITSGAEEPTVTVSAQANDGSGQQYTLTFEERDGHYVLTMTDPSTEASAFYVNRDAYGLEETWPEYIYPRLMGYLNSHLRGYSFWVEGMDSSLSGNAALSYLYEQFTLLGDYRDSADYVARFHTVPSMLTRVTQVTTDQLGNKSQDTVESYTYDEQGRLVAGKGAYMQETYGIYLTSTMYLEYGDNGAVSKITVGSDNNVSAVCTPEYDADGKLTAMQVQGTSAAYTSTFTYDDQGRLTRVDIPDGIYSSSARSFSYTYDEAGTMIQKVKAWNNDRYTLTCDYTYQGASVSEITENYEAPYSTPYTNHKVFTNDDQGRPVSMSFTTTNPSFGYAAQELVYNYEDVYFFDATGIEIEEN